MKTNCQHHSNRTGGILPLVMVILVAFSLMVVALLRLGGDSAREAEYQFNKAQAFSLAEAGLERFKAIVNSNRFPISTSIAAARDWSTTVSNAGSYRVVVTDDPSWNNTSPWGTKKYIITSTGSARNGAVQTNQLKAAIRTFGDYLWATHSENGVFFTTGDRIYGSSYTDDQLNINGTPIFYDLVQSAAASVNYQTGGNSSVFTGGLMLGVPSLDWPSVQQQVNDLAAASGAERFTGDYNITFADTTVTLSNRTSHSVSTRTVTAGSLKIFYVIGNAYVKGTVGTQVTVATTLSIHIIDDIVYKSATDPDPAHWATGWVPASTEALGLYSQTGAVQIDSGVGTVNIHAAILAPSGSFTAADHQTSHSGNWYINFFGSIGQYTRGAVGHLNNGVLDGGYLKNYHYDSRFGVMPPPGIPYSVFFFSEWKQF